MRIEVKQTHIDNGQRGECRTCPVALAVLDNLPVGWACLVAGGIEVFESPKDVFPVADYEWPDEVYDFISDFDDGEPVRPFSFPLPLEELGGGA